MSDQRNDGSSLGANGRREKVFLATIALVLALSALNVVLCIVSFDEYADAFVSIHRDSFNGIEDVQVERWILRGLLLIRSVVALSWIASFFYLKKMLKKSDGNSSLIMGVYSVLSAIGFGYLVLRTELPSLAVVRSVQAVACLALAGYLGIERLKAPERFQVSDQTEIEEKG